MGNHLNINTLDGLFPLSLSFVDRVGLSWTLMTLTAESPFVDTDECADPSLNACPKKKEIQCVNEISGHKDGYHCVCAPGYKSTNSNNAEGHDTTCEGKLIHVMFSCLWENNLWSRTISAGFRGLSFYFVTKGPDFKTYYIHTAVLLKLISWNVEFVKVVSMVFWICNIMAICKVYIEQLPGNHAQTEVTLFKKLRLNEI